MADNSPTQGTVRRFLKVFKVIFGLVLLVLEILKRIKDF